MAPTNQQGLVVETEDAASPLSMRHHRKEAGSGEPPPPNPSHESSEMARNACYPRLFDGSGDSWFGCGLDALRQVEAMRGLDLAAAILRDAGLRRVARPVANGADHLLRDGVRAAPFQQGGAGGGQEIDPREVIPPYVTKEVHPV